ncbi:LMBR1-like membrane protein-domain-containing protein [Aspergillus pseudoustus]|uniref:Probable lysosomal cobalamin transporter n=1 Tax=Aspergillus pseudoustus TaxID=1810923 RepID=A0ABR4IMA1_9EURO
MALLQTSLIWAIYAIAVAVLFVVASVFIYVYQTPRDRSPSVTVICIIAIAFLLATTLLLPVDVALVSATVSTAAGQRKDWATPEVVDKIIFSLTLIYYILYSVDILLCLLVIPFVYFWYEEYDEVATQAGEQNRGQQFWGAFKYTLSFVAILVILFLVGFFVPVSRSDDGNGLDFFKRLLTENRGERALTFAIGLLTTIGMCVFVIHTSTGLAILPVRLIKGGGSSVTSQNLKANSIVQLESNRERQRQLEGRCGGNHDHLSSKDRRELDALVREERTLIRRQRLAEEAEGEAQGFLMKTWYKLQAVFHPFKLLGGVLLLLVVLLTWVSMLLTAIDKAKNSICKHRCGYILGHITIFNPINQIFVQSAKVFPIDYVIFTLLVLIFFFGTVAGIATVGIRFLWINIFQVRKGHTSPQALLLMTAMLMLSILALNYTISMVAAPQYATFGPQTFCDRSPDSSGKLPDCHETKHLVKSCSEAIGNEAARQVCIPSIASTLLNRLTIRFPFFGVIFFWAQFAFLSIYLLALVTSLLRASKLNERQLDEDAENAEEEALLTSTRRRADTQWQSVINRASRRDNDV